MKKQIVILLVFLFSFAHPLFADDADILTIQAAPNVLIILDNSNSMDEDFWGNAIGSYSPNSKSVVGKEALMKIVDLYKEKMRVGLMAYKTSGISRHYLHNSAYFPSYNPKSYCPNPLPECVKYAQTLDPGARSACLSSCRPDNPLFDPDYFDEIITNYPVGSEVRNRYSNLIYPKTLKTVNPSDPSRFIYSKGSYPFYGTENEGTGFCYSTAYSPSESGSFDNYDCYTAKTGTSDDYDGYSNYLINMSLRPTDTDVALGYKDFGRRVNWYYVGQTWFSNYSPGNGYLHVPVGPLEDKTGTTSAIYTDLTNKLCSKSGDQSAYMSCTASDKDTCSYIVNAGLTPTAGTLQTSIDYFKGNLPGTESPIQNWCQKSFILYVTDGLPSVDESGVTGTADSLMDAVLKKIDTLRKIPKTVDSKDYMFDIKTYILGVGLSKEAKTQLDKMAVHGGTDVGGYAYYADNPDQLLGALQNIFLNMIDSSYSFTSPSVPAVQTIDQDTVYISTFVPNDKGAFWPGTLKAYRLNPDGTFTVGANGVPKNDLVWEASIPDPASRVIWTARKKGEKRYIDDLRPGDFGTNLPERNKLVPYLKNLKLGDIFHSNAVIVGAPSPHFQDTGYSGLGGFYQNNIARAKVIIAGANDGMLHAFGASAGTTFGMEQWAFIPDSLLKNLDSMLTSAVHKYYVDSTPKVADVWFDLDGDNTKSSGEWRTILVCGLRKGGNTYFALDITEPGAPTFLWEIQLNGKNSGQSWSEPAIGRVMVEGKAKGKTILTEKWVAFIGGGVDDLDSTKGMDFYVVDLQDGHVLWKYSDSALSTDEMLYPLPSSPTAVDTNFDGYVDKVYIGDLGGQMWVFNLSSDTIRMKSDSLWTGKRLFTAPEDTREKHPIYYEPAVAFDRRGTPWVFFGTGDREDPSGKRAQGTNIAPTPGTTAVERFYGVMDDGQGIYPRQEATLFNATANTTFNIFKTNPDVKGWYLQLANLEKVLARPTVFNRLLYFTTYTATGSDACQVYGNGKLYTVEYLSGGGAIDFSEAQYLTDKTSQRYSDIGTGIPSAPIVSILNSGGATVFAQTTDRQFKSEQARPRPISKDFLYWREVLH